MKEEINKKSNKHKQHGRIIAAQTSALTKSPLSTKTKFLFEVVRPTAQNNAWKRYTKKELTNLYRFDIICPK